MTLFMGKSNLSRHYTSKHESDFSEVLQRKLFHDAQALLRKGEKPGPKQRIYTSLDGEIFKGRDEEDQEQDQRQQVRVRIRYSLSFHHLAVQMHPALVDSRNSAKLRPNA